jgi:hypothetical protein
MNNQKTQSQTAAASILEDARKALAILAAQLDALEAQHEAKPKDWGIVGSMGHIKERLEILANNE